MTTEPTPIRPAGTPYVILRLTDDGLWAESGTETAGSSDGAIKRYAEREAAKGEASTSYTYAGGTYVAVPKRSWTPSKVTATVTTTVKVEEATDNG